MKRVAITIYPIMGICLLLLACVPGFAQETGSFQLIRGKAGFLRSAGATWLDLGPEPITVRTGDTVKTSDLSKGELNLPDGSLVRLKSNAQVKVLENALQLQVGEIWCQFQKQPRYFQVVTPTTLCSILGTTFDVKVDTFGKTQVRVFDGLVSVKAYSDQRKRNLVLQAGMWTHVENRNITEDQPRKFDVQQARAEIDKDWGLHAGEKIRLGPGNAGLPPLRAPIRDKQTMISIDGQPFNPSQPAKVPSPSHGKASGSDESDEDEEEPSGQLRDNLNFFENLGQQRLRENRAQESGQLSDHQKKTEKELRNTYNSEFSRGGGAYSLADQENLRDEIDRVQNQLNMLQEDIRSTQGEFDQLRQAVSPAGSNSATNPGVARSDGPPGKPDRLPLGVPVVPYSGGSYQGLGTKEIQDRTRLYQTRLQGLQEEQRRLIQRLQDLRNRLN